ncbi:MAG: hypothetical protein ACREQ5_09060 [Candidatus Dormibacteria bacterium]
MTDREPQSGESHAIEFGVRIDRLSSFRTLSGGSLTIGASGGAVVMRFADDQGAMVFQDSFRPELASSLMEALGRAASEA